MPKTSKIEYLKFFCSAESLNSIFGQELGQPPIFFKSLGSHMTFYIKTFNLTNFQSGALPFGSDPDPVLAQKMNLGSRPSKKLEIFNF
jgi:hypothetical protein